ncbi:unnamed protein product [Mycena citricolor]|uniref:CxC2-like cysteine cluster KDZ transposase-associated domain-containing protein n=1 Tax=Mycena citricolor TaxID=2018698 RepID=A0AAD2JW44_9AGAR|nr:unnamed protein product [Mycena citricolor]
MSFPFSLPPRRTGRPSHKALQEILHTNARAPPARGDFAVYLSTDGVGDVHEMRASKKRRRVADGETRGGRSKARWVPGHSSLDASGGIEFASEFLPDIEQDENVSPLPTEDTDPALLDDNETDDGESANKDESHVGGDGPKIYRSTTQPLHAVEEWNGSWWTKVSLAALGLIYQMGHGGQPCCFPMRKDVRMVIMHAPRIHDIRIRYCNCSKSDDSSKVQQLLRNGWYPATTIDPGTCATFETLESFRLYSTVGSLNARDFASSLEQMSNVSSRCGLSKTVDRYKQLQRIARQWAFLLRLLRAGRGHDPRGVEGTKLGECAIRCWACPQEGRNLPSDWQDVHASFRFLFMLLLAVDANFRLKNRIRAHEIEDPSLGPGYGYWVPPDEYKEHLKNYVSEEDTSTCIAFAALLQKNTRLTMGLRVSGVGGCVCARHEIMRPNGLGDLQKGERYANMAFIVFSALLGFSLMWLTLSYDIGCQWKLNLKTRMEKLPESLHLPLDKMKIQCGLPVWHAASHNADCQSTNSLSFKPGVGKTDGEGIERVWAALNPTGYATKTAGLGMRADVLEERIDRHNFMKNLGFATVLPARLRVAEREWKIQSVAFADVSSSVTSKLMGKWIKMIDDWLVDGSKPNPYVLITSVCVTENAVRLELRKDEERLLAEGCLPLKGQSATAFLIAGIQIEDAQRRLCLEISGTVVIAGDRANRIEEWRRSLLVKIDRFRDLQRIYIPGAGAVIEQAEVSPAPLPEKIKLWMPSEMPGSLGKDRGCVEGLVGMEVRLRVAQCENSLAQVRARLHAKRHMISFRNANVTGQVQSTKGRTIIDEIGEKVNQSAARYRRGREALVGCGKEVDFDYLRPLLPEDLHMNGISVAPENTAAESDEAAAKKLMALGAGRAPRQDKGASRRVMSWIWTAKGALEKEEEELHESIRVEWARARARRDRWAEEVLLLREEMRRVCAYLDWQSSWWKVRVDLREDFSAEVAAGAAAFAAKQSAWHLKLRGSLLKKWGSSIGSTSGLHQERVIS